MTKEIAYIELKEEIVNSMFRFINKYSTKGENCIYPFATPILINVLEDCLQEVKSQSNLSKTHDKDYVFCKKCYIQFDFTQNIVFTQKSSHCNKHDFVIPSYCKLHEIDEPVFFIRRREKDE